MSTKFKTLKEFLYPQGRKITFSIPNYQRGYKWAVKADDTGLSSAEYLLNSFLDARQNNPEQSFFLQGITVVENGNRVELIDGQQRITTIYLILRLLGSKYISGENNIDLQYEIRKDSGKFIESLKDETFDWKNMSNNDMSQDVFYFREALVQMQEMLNKYRDSYDSLVAYLLNMVSFLYIVVDRKQAVKTFTMMNGSKATMHQEELIKAQILHQVSNPPLTPSEERPATFDELLEKMKDYISREWVADALRSRYAREWDKWLYWWNRPEVQSFFPSANRPMGLLLKYYFWESCGDANASDLKYERFKQLLTDAESTRNVFKKLRDLQKKFEDIFSNPISHNYLKLSFIGASSTDTFKILAYFFDAKLDIPKMREYAQWRLVGATHKSITKEIITENEENERTKEDCARDVFKKLKADIVYNVCDDEACKQLLRLNVEEYNKLNGGIGVAFDFSIWGEKSLEHVMPKSWIYHMEEHDGVKVAVRGDGEIIGEESKAKADGLIKREEIFASGGSEHCIGNLVLLYKNNNSEFGKAVFAKKKKLFFNMSTNDFRFESRSLLHSIAVFSESDWTATEIIAHRENFLQRFCDDYGFKKEEM